MGGREWVVGLGQVGKVFSLLHVPSRLSLADAERHYVGIHVPLVARELGSSPDWLSYGQDRIVGRWDAMGGFDQLPDLWRFVHIRSSEPGVSPPASGMGFRQGGAHRDHSNFVGVIDRLEVYEETLLDRRAGQTSLAKVVFVIPRFEGTGSGVVDQRWLEHLRVEAPELRLLTANYVVCEPVMATDRHGSSVPTTETKAENEFSLVVEAWFDCELRFVKTLRTPEFVDMTTACMPGVRGYAVEEKYAFDHRGRRDA